MTTVAVLLAGCKKEDPDVVQSIEFTNVDNGKLTLLVGEDFRVKYTVEPASLQETAVLEWTSSKEDVASVRNGRISANEEGKATITATCGNATATISVEVEAVDVTDFKLPSSVSGYVGAPVKVEVTGIEPEGGSISSITWSMADESIATCHIDAGELYVTGVKQGTTKLIGEGLDVKRECSVTVKEYIPVQSVKVTLGKNSIGATSSTSVSLSVLPSNASVKDVRWTVSPSSYAEFDESSMTITAGENPGTVTITATAVNENVSGSAELTITPLAVETLKVKLPKGTASYCCISPDGSFSQPKTIQLTAEITPAAAKDSKITWKSHDTSRATVDQNGVVTATGHGGVLIEAECQGVKGYIHIGSVKKSSAMWKAYDTWRNGHELSSITRVYGIKSFCIIDPAGMITDEEGDIDYVGMYPAVNGQFYQPNLTLPANVTTDPSTGTYDNICGIDLRIKGAHSAAPITVDMGYGNKVTVNLTSGIKTFSICSEWGPKTPDYTVTNGGTLKIKRPEASSYFGEQSKEYFIYVNLNQYVRFENDYTNTIKCTNSGTTNLVDGYTLTIKSSTPKGSYVISADPAQYVDLASFTLIIE